MGGPPTDGQLGREGGEGRRTDEKRERSEVSRSVYSDEVDES